MKDIKELLPCPFCGHAAIIEQTEKNGLTIKCTACPIQASGKVIRFDLAWLRTKLVMLWNMRAPSAELTQTQQKLDVAVEALDKIMHRAQKHISMENDGYDLIFEMGKAALNTIRGK